MPECTYRSRVWATARVWWGDTDPCDCCQAPIDRGSSCLGLELLCTHGAVNIRLVAAELLDEHGDDGRVLGAKVNSLALVGNEINEAGLVGGADGTLAFGR